MKVKEKFDKRIWIADAKISYIQADNSSECVTPLASGFLWQIFIQRSILPGINFLI
jgi:hypothetical protein